MKTAFIFPGQGCQYAGMGRGFFEEFEVSRRVFETASAQLGLDMEELVFTENERLDETAFTQAALLTVSTAVLAAVRERGFEADAAAGLSLGEYGALVACGAMDFQDAVRVVRQRGILMEEAYPVGGAMAAVLGLSAEQVTEGCRLTEGLVSVANDNCPGQVVITGEEKAVRQAGERLREMGAKRVVPLNVSGPFHSELLSDAGNQLGKVLEEVKIHPFSMPYVTNVTGDYVREPGEVKELLVKQVSSPVLWRQSVERLIADGVDTFVELGPGRTLSGFVRKISRDVTVCNVEKPEDLARLEEIGC